MKKIVIYLSSALACLSLGACGDADLLNPEGVKWDINPRLHVPIAHGEVSFSDLLSRMDTTDVKWVETNGLLSLRYEFADLLDVKADDLANIQAIECSPSPIVLPKIEVPAGLPVDKVTELLGLDTYALQTEAIELDGITGIESLLLGADVELEISPSPIDLDLSIRFENLLDADTRKPYELSHKLLPGGSTSKRFENIHLLVQNLDPPFRLKYTTRAVPTQIDKGFVIDQEQPINIRINILHPRIEQFAGKLAPRKVKSENMATAFDSGDYFSRVKDLRVQGAKLDFIIESNHLDASFKFLPEIRAVAENRSLSLTCNELTAKCNDTGNTDAVVVSLNQSNSNLDELFSLPPSKGIEIGGAAELSPGGERAGFTKDMFMRVKGNINLPLHFKLGGYELTDTIPLKTTGLPNDYENLLKTLSLKILTSNSIPLEVSFRELIFCKTDKSGNSIGNKLFTIPVTGQVAAADVNAEGMSLGAKWATIATRLTKEQIRMLKDATHVILQGSVLTRAEQPIQIRSTDKLNVSVIIEANN